MEKESSQPALSPRERLLQHAFYTSHEGFRRRATIGGAAIIIDGGEATIGARPRPAITQESNPELYKAYQNWLIQTGRS